MTDKPQAQQQPPTPQEIAAKTQENFEAAKDVLEKFREQLFTKFEDYVLSIAVLPPRPEDKEKIATLILVDDQNSNKTPKAQLREKLIKVFDQEAAKVDKRILPEVLLLSELWQYCYDGKYEVLQDLYLSAVTYDVGILQAVRLSELHKQLVLQKFEKYIVSYVLGGSLIQGTATTKSDVDVFIIIDDTDVKKMTRAELRDKLRAIIIDLGFQAGDATGVKNKINIQTYLLTDFWEYVKEANPVIFTFLRDGVPLYDRGTFMPWKQLLEMGKVKPSPEAIEIFMSSGEQYLKRAKLKLKEIGIEDFFWATTTPAQAAIMMYGRPPPTPKELVGVLRDLFVKGKDKFLKEEDVKKVEYVLKVRKDMEHGDKPDITGAEIDDLYKKSEEFLKTMNALFEKIQSVKDEESVVETYENTVTLVRDVLRAEGHDVKEADLIKTFEKELVQAGHVPEKFIRILKDIDNAKADYDKGKLTKSDVKDIQKTGREFFKHMLEYLQRKRGREIERAKIRIKYGEKLAEVLVLEDGAYICHDIQAQEKRYTKANVKKDGGLGKDQDISIEEYEEAIANAKPPASVFVKEALFESLKGMFGKDLEILL